MRRIEKSRFGVNSGGREEEEYFAMGIRFLDEDFAGAILFWTAYGRP